MPEPIELRDAYAFSCHQCGHLTYVLPIEEPITAAERVEIADDIGIPPDDVDDCWERTPDRVQCDLCLKIYDVAVPPDDEDGEPFDDD